jgi:hypothetical protein
VQPSAPRCAEAIATDTCKPNGPVTSASGKPAGPVSLASGKPTGSVSPASGVAGVPCESCVLEQATAKHANEMQATPDKQRMSVA